VSLFLGDHEVELSQRTPGADGSTARRLGAVDPGAAAAEPRPERVVRWGGPHMAY